MQLVWDFYQNWYSCYTLHSDGLFLSSILGYIEINYCKFRLCTVLKANKKIFDSNSTISVLNNYYLLKKYQNMLIQRTCFVNLNGLFLNIVTKVYVSQVTLPNKQF